MHLEDFLCKSFNAALVALDITLVACEADTTMGSMLVLQRSNVMYLVVNRFTQPICP